jgi:signal transduction histidine kinase
VREELQRDSLPVRLVASRSRVVLAVSLLFGATATVLIAVFSQLDLEYRAPELHVAVETAASLIALLASFLVFGRVRIGGRLNDLLLASALLLLALANLFFVTIPATLGWMGVDFSVWSSSAARILGAPLLCLAAFAPARPLRRSAAATRLALASCISTIALISAGEYAFSNSLPAAVHVAGAGLPSGSSLVASPTFVGIQIATAALFSVAAIGFARRAERGGDEFMSWLAVGTMFGALSRINFALHPTLYSQWVSVGDVFRLASYVIILAGAASEIVSYWSRLATVAVLEERRRIARDLHDGVAQELAFIGRNAELLETPDDIGERIRAAATRALAESRRAIEALSASTDAPIDEALARATREVAENLGAGVDLNIVRGVRVAGERREALLRIAREAVSNAVRHGGASRVHVDLSRSGDLIRLRVVDRGCGFDPRGRRSEGRFGLSSMRERASALGGEFRLASAPGRGTEVEVVL